LLDSPKLDVAFIALISDVGALRVVVLVDISVVLLVVLKVGIASA
jgi:hypothetical protein